MNINWWNRGTWLNIVREKVDSAIFTGHKTDFCTLKTPIRVRTFSQTRQNVFKLEQL